MPIPRIPLDGMLDLTYRCNNHCLHCWLWESSDDSILRKELTFAEIRHVVDQARQLGCQAWKISGGEPMLREDFSEIFDYITHKATHYSLNTNGTLITPQIARLLTRKGRKMVAIYGATAQVHDQVTRNPGSFEAVMRGLSYLQEAGAQFEIQVIPMRANIHQYEQMLALAQGLSPQVRIGSSWLFLSASRSETTNRVIRNQRLTVQDVVRIDPPDPLSSIVLDRTKGGIAPAETPCAAAKTFDDRLFAACIEKRRDFHIDPYGGMSFCYYVKDPALRYDLKQGSFREAWEEFIPSLKESVYAEESYYKDCGACELREDCHWCPVYAYLEHGRYSAKVEYLCEIAKETRRYKEDWRLSHFRYYQIAGITIRVSADFVFDQDAFDPKFSVFQVAEPGQDLISLHHVSQIPEVSELRLGTEIYHQAPWAIYQHKNSYIYMDIPPEILQQEMRVRAIFNQDHSKGTIFHDDSFKDRRGLQSLSSFVSDQILLARVLADREGFYLHASGINLNGQGFLFVGHSGAGKSTMLKMLRSEGEILCDDRMIVRRWPEGFRIHGTWSHGELPDVSPASVPLRAIFYLEQANKNALIPIQTPQKNLFKLLPFVVKPLQTADWWENVLDTVDKLVSVVPAYRLQFDLSGEVVDLIKRL